MRAVPAGIAAQLAPGAVGTLAMAWIVRRTDGTVLGFTEHDQPLTVSGVVCAAATGLSAVSADMALGARPGEGAVDGVLDAASLSEADIAAGRYDQAAIEAWQVDWTAGGGAMLMWRGTFARLERQGTGFVAHIAGPLAALTPVVGRTYQRSCDAVLGDARCRVDLTLPANAGATCDKAWRTCRDRFANLINFQGFPDLPGDDYLAVYASDSPGNTGGSRRT